MQKRIPAVLMRGGTSRGLFLKENHLPSTPEVRDKVILTIFGSPDPNTRQIDGIGGGTSVTSKVAIISPSKDPLYDVVYNFGQVSIDRSIVDFKGNCGNISSAVGPFAIDEGLVNAVEPITRVRIFQKNTNKLIIADVPVKDGKFNEEGCYTISGVPTKNSKIDLYFSDPAGALTGKLFPTGNYSDEIKLENGETVLVTIIDAANPVIVLRAESIGLNGTEITTIDSNITVKKTLEFIRSTVAVMLGFSPSTKQASQTSQAVPKIAFITRSQEYTTTSGSIIKAQDIDIVARIMSMGDLHKSYAVSGAIATAGALMIPGTVIFDLLDDNARQQKYLRIGHPGGIIEVGATIKKQDNFFYYAEATVARTARRIMEGYVLVQKKTFRINSPH